MLCPQKCCISSVPYWSIWMKLAGYDSGTNMSISFDNIGILALEEITKRCFFHYSNVIWSIRTSYRQHVASLKLTAWHHVLLFVVCVCVCVCVVTGDVETDPGIFSLLQLRHQWHGVLLPASQQRLTAPPAAGQAEGLASPGTCSQEGQGQSLQCIIVHWYQ